MNIVPTTGMTSSLTAGLTGAAGPTSSGGSAFGQVVQRFIDDTNVQQIQADIEVERLATGQSDSLHESMLALTKADLSLRMFMEVRNKVIDAYQEVMRMQL